MATEDFDRLEGEEPAVEEGETAGTLGGEDPVDEEGGTDTLMEFDTLEGGDDTGDTDEASDIDEAAAVIDGEDDAGDTGEAEGTLGGEDDTGETGDTDTLVEYDTLEEEEEDTSDVDEAAAVIDGGGGAGEYETLESLAESGDPGPITFEIDDGGVIDLDEDAVLATPGDGGSEGILGEAGMVIDPAGVEPEDSGAVDISPDVDLGGDVDPPPED